MAVCVPYLLYRCVHHRRQFYLFFALPSAHFRIIGSFFCCSLHCRKGVVSNCISGADNEKDVVLTVACFSDCACEPEALSERFDGQTRHCEIEMGDGVQRCVVVTCFLFFSFLFSLFWFPFKAKVQQSD